MRSTFALAACVAALGSASPASAQSWVQMSGNGTDPSTAYAQLNSTSPGVDTISVSGSSGASSSAVSLTLSTGQVHLDVVSAYGLSGFNATGEAVITDTLTFAGDLSAPYTGTLSFTLDGKMTPGGGQIPGSGGNAGSASAALSLGTLGFAGLNHTSFYVSETCSTISLTADESCTVGSTFAETISLPFTIDDAHRMVNLTASLYGQAFNGAHVDFANTGTLSLVLPSGLSFTSESGLLLTAQTAPVPEPQTYVLMLAGVGFVAARRLGVVRQK